MPQLFGFLLGYVECALWASGMDGVNGGIDRLSPAALDRMAEDCVKFRTQCHTLLTMVQDQYNVSDEQLGHDFWLTRNGHGSGYWDRDIGALGDALAKAARAQGERHLWQGETGTIYQE